MKNADNRNYYASLRQKPYKNENFRWAYFFYFVDVH